MIIAIDFDGTLHRGKDWPETGAPAPGAVEAMQRLKEDGHYLIVWTCREGQYEADMVNWLIKHKIPFDCVNEHAPGVEVFGYESRKVFADVYIDDHNLGGLPSWREIYDIISGRVKPLWLYKMLK
jgi:hypothetical protein